MHILALVENICMYTNTNICRHTQIYTNNYTHTCAFTQYAKTNERAQILESLCGHVHVRTLMCVWHKSAAPIQS